MGVEVLEGKQGDVFVCNTTDTAFGPLMEEGSGEAFLQWLPDDPRIYEVDDLCHRYQMWYDNVYTKEEVEEVEYE